MKYALFVDAADEMIIYGVYDHPLDAAEAAGHLLVAGAHTRVEVISETEGTA